MSSNENPGAGGNPPSLASPPNPEDFTPEIIAETRAGSERGAGGVPLELTATLRIGGGATRFGGQEGGGVRIGAREGEDLVVELRATAIIRGGVPRPGGGSREDEESAEENR